MWKRYVLRITLAGLCSASPTHAANFAQAVEGYDPGTGFATEFGTGLGYTNAAAALGQPNRETAFGPVTPFNPPYERTELVSLGQNGYLVVRLDQPVWNLPNHPFGLDFVIYGNTGFVDVDYPNGQADELGSIFGQNNGATRVSVSQDNVRFFSLDPTLAPVVDGLYPTDGAGLFGWPVDPSLTPADFANLDLASLRALYANSAGGAAYDLTWARDETGLPVVLDHIQYVRVDVLAGHSEIDGFAAVPEPSAGLLLALAVWGVLLRQRGLLLPRRHPGHRTTGKGLL